MIETADARLTVVAMMAAVTMGSPAAAIAQSSPSEMAADHRCANGADVRRIEIRFADGDGSLPCKVIYRPETESDTLGIVSWQDIDSVAACRVQADEVIDMLTAEGWSCVEDEGAEIVDNEGIADFLAAEVAEERAKLVQAEADPPEGDAPASNLVEPTIYSDDPGQLDEEDIPAILVDNPDLPAPPDDLVALIEDDLARLDTSLDGVLEAQVAGYGDLNGDDIEDALVLYSFTSPQPAYRQFLIAYVFDGETYQLTATKPVGGHTAATMAAKVETIDQGVIHMTLQAFEPGDAFCCPSGTRRLALTLQDLDLVELDADVPTR